MPAPTVAVTIRLSDGDGNAYASTVVTARLDKSDSYVGAEGAYVISDRVTGTTDANGEVVLNLFPNHPTTGLGTTGSTWYFSARPRGASGWHATAQIPDSDCDLIDIADQPVVAGLSAAEIAEDAAQAHAATAKNWATKTDGEVVVGEGYGAKKYAQDAAAQADIATGAADAAVANVATVAGIAGEIATVAGVAADVTAVAGVAGNVTTVAGIAADVTTVAGASADVATVADSVADVSTVAGGIADVTTAATNIAAIQAAPAAATAAQTAETNAEAAQAATEVARDAALAATRIYASTAAGLAGTTSGQYFYVPSGQSHESLVLYLNNAGSAVEQKRYLSSTLLSQYAPPGYQWAVVDASYNAALGVQDDGTVGIGTAQIGTASIENLGLASGDTLIDSVFPGFALVLGEDDAGNAAVGIRDDGTFSAKAMETDTLNGSTVLPGDVARRGGIYSHQINFINCSGQSLMEGSTPAVDVTTAQEYDNIGFAARASSPTGFLPLTTGNTKYAARGESPMYGALGFIKDRILNENGISYSINDYQLAACNNGYSGYDITALNQGTAPYIAALSQVQAAYDIATAAGQTMAFQAVMWGQGEAGGYSVAAYKAHLIELARDYNADGKAITGQTHDVRLFCYQVATVNRNHAIAQLEASNESPLITLACPMYQFNYGDSTHIDSTSSKWLGGYFGLAYKRVVIDGDRNWKPLQPVGHAVLGSIIDLIFNKTGLVLDTTLVAAQTNYGFSVKNGAGVAQTIISVALVAPNRVRITVSGTPAAGWTVQYGNNSASGRSDSFVGGCGNLRDSQGDTITYAAISKTMHNWCVLFDYTI